MDTSEFFCVYLTWIFLCPDLTCRRIFQQFKMVDGRSGCHAVGTRLVREKYGAKWDKYGAVRDKYTAERMAVLGRFHSQVLFMDEVTMNEYILDTVNAQHLLLPNFVAKLAAIVDEGTDLMERTWLLRKALPNIKQHYCAIKHRLDIGAALGQPGQDATVARLKDPASKTQLMAYALGMVGRAEGAMDRVSAALIGPAQSAVLKKALAACSKAAVVRRKQAAEADMHNE